MTLEDKMRELINNKFGSVRQFSLEADIPYTTVLSILDRGIMNSKTQNVLKMCKVLGIKTNNLLQIDESIIDEIIDISFQLTPPRQHKVYTFAQHQLEEQRNVIDLQEIKESSTQFVTGRRTAAGSALYVDDTDARHDVLPSSLVPKGADELVEVVGDSMEPLIHNGEHVYIRYQPQVECGEVAIVRIEDEGVTCKRVYIDGDKVKLRSENDAYDDMIFNADQITILGKVLI